MDAATAQTSSSGSHSCAESRYYWRQPESLAKATGASEAVLYAVVVGSSYLSCCCLE